MPNRHWEEEMLGEYLARLWPHARVITRVRLGPITPAFEHPGLTDSERRMLGDVARRWADAVVVLPDRLLVVETAMIPEPRDISLLETYLALVAATPELQEFRGLPVRGVLVWAVDDPYSRVVALKHGLEVHIFKPSNLREYLTAKRARETGRSRAARPVRANPV